MLSLLGFQPYNNRSQRKEELFLLICEIFVYFDDDEFDKFIENKLEELDDETIEVKQTKKIIREKHGKFVFYDEEEEIKEIIITKEEQINKLKNKSKIIRRFINKLCYRDEDDIPNGLINDLLIGVYILSERKNIIISKNRIYRHLFRKYKINYKINEIDDLNTTFQYSISHLIDRFEKYEKFIMKNK